MKKNILLIVIFFNLFPFLNKKGQLSFIQVTNVSAQEWGNEDDGDAICYIDPSYCESDPCDEDPWCHGDGDPCDYNPDACNDACTINPSSCQNDDPCATNPSLCSTDPCDIWPDLCDTGGDWPPDDGGDDDGGYDDDPDWLECFYTGNCAETPDFSPTCATTVKVIEDPVRKYGFDDLTNPAIPWKSIEEKKSDIVKTSIMAASDYKSVFFTVAPFTVDLQPLNPPSAEYNLSMTAHALPAGVKKQESEVQARCKANLNIISKFNIATYQPIQKTVAVRLVNSQSSIMTGTVGYNSTDVDYNVIIDFLNNKCYNQGIVQWTVIRLPAMSVLFDLNNDKKLDTETWMSQEMARIRDACKDDSYDANIFLVDNGSHPGGYGFMAYGQRYGYIHVNMSPNAYNTIAHELGHGSFGLVHSPDNDKENIMYWDCIPNSSARLRKNQWDVIHQ